jgi:putative membrane protein insertion efficiency factor
LRAMTNLRKALQSSFPKLTEGLREQGIRIALVIIRGYQVCLSPLLGPRCRFYPTCSQYAAEAISRYGLLKGTFLSSKRLLKCHPFHPGGIDDVP